MEKSVEVPMLFTREICAIFDGYLEKYQFIRTDKKAEKYFFSVNYRNGERYIHFGCTLHPHDYPYYWYLTLGEGTLEFPESDWNKIALWRLFEHKDDNKELFNLDYNISEDQIRQKLELTRILLEKYGFEFLNGNLSTFYRLRGDMNKGREPYKIYKKNKDGKYEMEFDEESKELKDKFSK
jgi:hypothetical protein